MKLNEFVSKIEEILEDNCIKYFYTNIGHIQLSQNEKSLLYFTKDIMIFFHDNDCVIDIQFSLADNMYFLKEMTITLDDEDYGYKYCILNPKRKEKLRYNIELNENVLNNIIDYIIECIKYDNDLESLRNIWEKSLKRSEFKKIYPKFHIDNATYIDNEKFEEIDEIFNCVQNKNGEIIFFFKDNQIDFNYVDRI